MYSEESRQAPEASDARLQPARSPIKATGKESIHQRDVVRIMNMIDDLAHDSPCTRHSTVR